MNEAWFFVGLLVFILVVWIALGGPTRGIALSFPTVSYASSESADATTSTSGGIALPHAPFGIGGTSVHLPDIYEGIGGSENSSGANGAPLINVPGIILPALSPYSSRVQLGSVVNASSSDATTEYLRLTVASDNGPSIDITGWQLLSGATYKNAYVPRGTLLPATGVVNATSDIVLDAGDSATIVSGLSPVGGSFRENKCTGYFGSVQTFTPSLASSCPSAADELVTYYGSLYIHDPSCIDYTNALGRCRVPVSGTGNLSPACQGFLNTYVNYTGCVSSHQLDADFPSTAWRIYLGRSQQNPLWRSSHEVVELLDRNGLLVDAFSY